jgi:hypothetical protein
MVLNPVEWVLMAGLVLQTLTAAVTSMNKPRKDYGAYLFWYRFCRQMMNIADEQFEKRFHMPMPRIVDESATQTVTTPTTQIETAVSKTTTTTS